MSALCVADTILLINSVIKTVKTIKINQKKGKYKAKEGTIKIHTEDIC